MNTCKHIFTSVCLLPMWCSAGITGGHFSPGEGSTIRDLAAWPDGSIVACGSLGVDAALPAGIPMQALLPGTSESGDRGFVCAWTPDLKSMRWIAVFPADTIKPTRMAVAADGSIAIGGKHLGGLAAHDKKGDNWTKGDGALAKLSADGKQVLWVSPGGPNQGEITGLDIDAKGRVYYSAGSKVRSAANYLLRKNGTTGAGEDFAETGWCVYLHHNQEALKAEGQYFSYYDKTKQAKEGFDYDGEGGWGPVSFSLQGFRIGGNVLTLPGGEVLISSGLQYDFREQGKKKFPAFDYFLARYSEDGELRWSTNLYQPGDSVHTPDQKPIDLAYDAARDTIYALVKQHGSNVYRFKGELVGDTGNLMISWLGKVDAQTGVLQEGWYFQNNRAGNYHDHGIPASPPYPKLAGNQLQRVAVSGAGRVVLAGNGAPQMWTTPNALQPWPKEQTGGGNAALLVHKPDLTEVDFATCLFTDTSSKSSLSGLAVTDRGMFVAGRGIFGGAVAKKAASTPWSSQHDEAGCLILGLVK